MDHLPTRGGFRPPLANRREFLRISGLIGLAAGGGVALNGCSIFGEDEKPESGAKTLRITFSPVEVLDPQVITNGMWILTRGILEGLVAQNEKGDDVIPAVAEKWEVSEDLLTYTFTLRESAAWSNGDPVTAKDFEETYKRLFTPGGTSAGGTTLGANSYQASTGIKGATEFLGGATKDWSEVGVEATGERELTLTLANPNPDFLLALTHPALLPLHMKSVTEMPDDWQEPPNYVSNGAYAVKSWEKNSSLTLVPNEKYWERDGVSYDQIKVLLVEPTASGTGSVPYENNETDILPIGDADVLHFQEDPELAKVLQTVNTYGIVYLAKLRSQNPALEDRRVRQALSMTLDRKTLAGVTPGSEPGKTLVTSRVQGWDESLALGGDVEKAQKLLAEAGFPNGKGLPEIRILAGVTSPLVEAIADVWKKNLGIKVRPDPVEAGVYVERRWQVQKGDYIGFYFGSFAGLPTWPTMVGALWSPLDVQKFSMPSAKWAAYQKLETDKKMDGATRSKKMSELISKYSSDESQQMAALVAKAFKEPDDAKRQEMFQQAARIREEEALYIPVTWTSSFYAVRPSVQGLALRPYPDHFYLKPLKPAAE